MATGSTAPELQTAMVKKFGSVNGAKKDSKPTDYSAAAGTSNPKP
jgi:hypothetical protein